MTVIQVYFGICPTDKFIFLFTAPLFENSSYLDNLAILGKYKNVREVALKKGESGWGIMILEGKHSIAGTGVFVSDLQPGSCAEKAGLLRGDMILAVNGEDFVGVNYDTAARILKTLDGVITMIVANANIDCHNASNHDTNTASDETSEEKITTQGSPEKPKLPPKPAIAPKPAGISPSHTA